MKSALSTSIDSDSARPPLATGGATRTGTMAPGATASIVAPKDWSGNIAFGQAKYPQLGKASLVELTFGDLGLDIDVSYV